MTAENSKLDLNKRVIRVAYLTKLYIREQLTLSEHDELDDWVNESLDNQLLFEAMTDDLDHKYLTSVKKIIN